MVDKYGTKGASARTASLYDAITAHRQASAAFEAAGKARGKMVGDEPGWATATAKWEMANEAEEESARNLCAYPCQSIEEVHAKAKYLSNSPLVRDGLTGEQVAILLGSFAEDAAGGAGVLEPEHSSALAPDRDAELLSLGEAFERAWAIERAKWDAGTQGMSDDDVAEICAPCVNLSDRIVAIPARSLAGLLIKARVALWCHAGKLEELNLEEFWLAMDERIGAAIVRDLLAIFDHSEGGQ